MGYISRWAGLYIFGMTAALFASLLISSVEIFILRKTTRMLIQRRPTPNRNEARSERSSLPQIVIALVMVVALGEEA